ncbi:MAG: amidohydrolase, partial [bacterium]|nr:amidohydrolase [bacterium]
MLDEMANQLMDEMISHRRNLHRIPELGFQEYKTQEYILRNIRDFVDEYKILAKTGVVGFLNNGSERTVLLRADMDGLPIKEENDVDYKSVHEGVMHACGHDSHMSVLIALVKYFYSNRRDLGVNLRYMFQPAEEGLGGARAMIEEGVLEDVDFALAIHVWNELEYGKIALGCGPTMASSDSFEVEIVGKGAHAATPSLAVDPILTSSLFINQVYTIFPRIFKDYVVSFTYINAGSANNIIPGSCFIKGTVRSFDEDTRKRIAGVFEKNLRDVCSSTGATYVLKYDFGYPVLVNDHRLYEIGVKVASEIVGKENIQNFRSYGSEDMAFVLQKVPGLYVAIGSGIGNPHHSPK